MGRLAAVPSSGVDGVNRKVLAGGGAAGLALFVWSVLAWTLVPIYETALRTLPVEEEVVGTLRRENVPSGVYLFPGIAPRAGVDPAAGARDWESRVREGPLGLLVVRARGASPNRMFRPLASMCAVQLLAGLFASWSLSRARLSGNPARIGFVIGLGLFAWLLGTGMPAVWFHYPASWLLATFLDAAAGWAFAGVVLAGIVRPTA